MPKVSDINLQTAYQQSTPVFHYYHRDHLGNTCVVWNATADSVVQRTLYYASGMPMAGSTGQSYQPYKYNGKEFVTEYGYDTYDYGFRGYYPAIGRFTSVDPLAEKYYNISPYAYCANNPVKYVDLDGREIVIGRWYGRILALMGIKDFEYKVQKNIEKLNALSPELAETISRLENSKTTYYILPITERSDYNVNSKQLNWNAYKNHIIYYDPDNIHGALGIRPPEAGLIHEMGHAENDDKGETIEYDAKAAIKGNTEEKDKWNKNEKHSIELENKVYESEGINLKRDEKYIK